jgi:hypothetical protein
MKQAAYFILALFVSISSFAADRKTLETKTSEVQNNTKTDNQKSVANSDSKELRLGYEVFTKESIVSVGGHKYRKVEYKNQTYYLELIEAGGDNQRLKVMCDPAGIAQGPNQIRLSTKISKRSSLFVEGLNQICKKTNGQERVTVDPNIFVGFSFDDDDPSATFKNKKIFIVPFTMGAGFSAEW